MKIKIPGKIFIAGEYGALKGFPTLSVAVEPGFIFQSSDASFALHPDSPAGRFLPKLEVRGTLQDPYASTGGMGKSTAEFLVKYFADTEASKSVEDVWKAYRYVTRDQSTPPSGVDVATQVLGGYCVTEWSKNRFEQTNWSFENLDWAVILTGYKVKTHEHLETLKNLSWDEIQKINHKLAEAFQLNNEAQFIAYMRIWREFLLKSGLEVPTTTEIVEALLEIPGVMAAKGCGALGSDAVFVLFEKSATKLMEKVLEDWNANSVIRSSQVTTNGVEVTDENLRFSSL